MNPYVRRPTVGVGQSSINAAKAPLESQGIGATKSLTDEEWINSYGPTMCEFFKSLGSKQARLGDATHFKSVFNDAFAKYVSPGTERIREFAWSCFVQGNESGQAEQVAENEGWGTLHWLLAAGAAGIGGLFLWNYAYSK